MMPAFLAPGKAGANVIKNFAVARGGISAEVGATVKL